MNLPKSKRTTSYSFLILCVCLYILLFACKSNGITSNKTGCPNGSPQIPKNTVSIEISVLKGMNSTQIVKGATLKVFESAKLSDDNTKLNEKSEARLASLVKIEGEVVCLTLESGKHYDFVAEGNEELAASAITNLKIREDLKLLTIIQLEKRLPNRVAEVPRLTAFYAEINDDARQQIEGSVPIIHQLKDGTSLPLPLNARIKASVFTRGGTSQQLFYRDFAAKLGFGITPSSATLPSHPFLAGLLPAKNETYKKDEGWQNNFTFNIQGHHMGRSNEVDLVFVCYDVQGNRLEHHTLLNFSTTQYQAYPSDDIKFNNITCRIKSTHSNIHLYSKGAKNSYYFPNFSFSLSYSLAKEVVAIKLFRRKQSSAEEGATINTTKADVATLTSSATNANNQEERREQAFVKVAEVLYDRGKLSRHVITDTYGGLALGTTYEYKIRVFLKDGFYLDSSLIPCKILLPFEAMLLSPHNHENIASLEEFSFKVVSYAGQTRDVFSYDNADYFAFGLLVRSFQDERVFSASFKYHLNERLADDERLEIATSSGNFHSLKSLKQQFKLQYPEIERTTCQDFVNIEAEKGIVTIKKAALRFANVATHHKYMKCVPYYWDIVFWKSKGESGGIESSPCAFYKESKTKEAKIVASSHANIVLSTAYTTNGAFTFTVDNGETSGFAPSLSYIIKVRDEASLGFLQKLDAKITGDLKISSESGQTYYSVKSTQGKDILSSLLSCEGVLSAEYDHPVRLIKPLKARENERPRIFSLTSASVASRSSFCNNAEKNEQNTIDAHMEALQAVSSFNQCPLNDPLLPSLCYSLDITSAKRAYGEFGFGKNKVMAAIIDTGVNAQHEDLSKEGVSIVKTFENDDVFDDDGHGTHCAGIIAGLGANNLGIAGVSWKNTELFVLKIANESTFKTYKRILKFISYVEKMREQGKIRQKTIPLNMSFGAEYPNLLALEMIEKALKAGILPVVAMGNSASLLSNYPACYPGVLAVGSSNGRDELSAFSSRGEHISIVAPGEAIMSLGKDFSNHYWSQDGTSMAAPFVCGAIAYLMSFNSELTPFRVKAILEETACKIEGDANFNAQRGYGRINVYEAAKKAINNEGGHSRFFTGQLKIHDSTSARSSIVSIYSEKNICILCSHFASNGTLTINGLLPGKYRIMLNKKTAVERREVQLTAFDEGEVSVVF